MRAVLPTMSTLMPDKVCIRTFSYRHEAEFAKSVLEAKDIEAVVLADDAGGMNAYLGLGTGGVRLCVHRSDATRARTILKPTAGK